MRKMHVVFLLLLLAPQAVAQTAAEAREAARAKHILDQTLQALGGEECLQQINSLLVIGKGTEFRSAEVQGRHPDKDTPTPHEERLAVNRQENKAAYEYRTARHDGSVRHRRYIYAEDLLTFADLMARQAGQRRSTTEDRLGYLRRVPHLLLWEAAQHSDRLRVGPETEVTGRPHQVLLFGPPDAARPLKLFLDRETYRLSKFEYSMDFPGLGEAVVEMVFQSWQAAKNLTQFPTGHQLRIAGKVYQEVRYEQVVVNDPLVEAAFTLPEELQHYLTPPGATTEITKGVFLVSNLSGFNPLFVEFKDFVLAVEAPARHPALDSVPPRSGASNEVSDAFIRKIRGRVPTKPIRYVAVTHYHSDHAGGVPAFLAAGATLLTTPSNQSFFARLGNASGAGSIETIPRKRVLTDGEQTVEIINVGTNPHTDEMLVVYLPRANFIYQGDLFYYSGHEAFPARARVIPMQFFARWLMQQRLSPHRIYGFHDFGFATMEHVRRILRWREQ